jgi:hypothetical protein
MSTRRLLLWPSPSRKDIVKNRGSFLTKYGIDGSLKAAKPRIKGSRPSARRSLEGKPSRVGAISAMPAGQRPTELLQAEKLDNKGYVVIPNAVDEAVIDAVSVAYDGLSRPASPARFKQGSSTVRIDDILTLDACFTSFLELDWLPRLVREIVGPRFVLSSFHGRTLSAKSGAQKLHVDIDVHAPPWQLVGFILMIDPFCAENGATRFVPRSANLSCEPADIDVEHACGPAGSLIAFNGSTWHGHGANGTNFPRRSLQGAVVRWGTPPAIDFAASLDRASLSRLSLPVRRLLC